MYSVPVCAWQDRKRLQLLRYSRNSLREKAKDGLCLANGARVIILSRELLLNAGPHDLLSPFLPLHLKQLLSLSLSLSLAQPGLLGARFFLLFVNCQMMMLVVQAPGPALCDPAAAMLSVHRKGIISWGGVAEVGGM